MSWDARPSAHVRRRSTLSSSRALPGHSRQPKAPAEPKSAHVADPFLQPFLSATFDPAEYLNASLPPLRSPSSSSAAAAPLADASAQAQALLSQLNAHTTRLTNTLTQLTDEILRSGSRLAYEVELLRGETLTLSEALTEGLQQDMDKFVPSGLLQTSAGLGQQREAEASPGNAISDPQFISQLQTLTLVRTRLDSVIKAFGDAMEFVFPPSELSVGSSFLSVSAPEPGQEAHSTEEKGQQVLRKLREEIAQLLVAKNTDPLENIGKANSRLEELRDLLKVWNGTAEEKGRSKFVDSLAKTVEDRQKEVTKEMEQSGRRDTKNDTAAENSPRKTAGATEPTAEAKSSGYGLMSQWQKLRIGYDY